MGRGKPQKYFLSEQGRQLLLHEYDSKPGTVKRLAQELQAPHWRIRSWAKQHKVHRPRWTKEDDAYIERVYCHLPLASIAQSRKREKVTVRYHAHRLGINKRTDGYTIKSLSEAMHCHHRKVKRWINQGWLKASKRQARQKGDIWYISDAAVYDLLTKHANDIDMSRIDQLWLQDVLAGTYGLGVLSVQ